ncbi:phosphopyruvate hydratase [bacterium]|nr:phosphopyruvate hydratase [bacterium]
MAYKISKIHGREILDSRGNPTIEVEMTLSNGSWGRAMVPSGASTGEHEALELRDGDPKRFLGKGTLKAVKNVNEDLSRLLEGKSFSNVHELDQTTLQADGTPQKEKYGANALLGISLAFVHAVAAHDKRPLFLVMNQMLGLNEGNLRLPVPLMNILNGGLHANNGLEIQEFMIVPHGFETFAEALRSGCEVFQCLKKKLHDLHLSTAVGDEGGFAPILKNNEQALEFIAEAVQKAGYQLGKQISLALDVAASSFFDKKTQHYSFDYLGKKQVSREELISYYEKLLEKFPLVSVEDGLDENDWSGWKAMTEKLGKRLQLVGDDLFVTQPLRVAKGINEKVANSVLIKVNQVGTLSETFDTMLACKANQYTSVASHRSGETEDVTIAHLAVGSGCGQIKTGSVSRSERTAKYNELLRIEEWGKLNNKKIPYENIFRR